MTLEILVVDDKYSSEICRNMNAELNDKRVSFCPARSGDEAIEMVREREFDLIILDYNMPRKNGYQTAKELRTVRPNAKLAGFSSDWYQDKAKEVGLVVYSNDQSPLVNYIANLLNQKN